MSHCANTKGKKEGDVQICATLEEVATFAPSLKGEGRYVICVDTNTKSSHPLLGNKYQTVFYQQHKREPSILITSLITQINSMSLSLCI